MLGLAIAVSILLRGRPNRPRLFFAALAFDTGLWYLAQWLYHSGRSDLWARWTAVLAVFLPQFALHLFEAIVPEPGRRSMLLRVASILVVPMLVLVSRAPERMVRGWGSRTCSADRRGLYRLARRGERSGSRAVPARALMVCRRAGDMLQTADLRGCRRSVPLVARVEYRVLFCSPSRSRATMVDRKTSWQLWVDGARVAMGALLRVRGAGRLTHVYARDSRPS